MRSLSVSLLMLVATTGYAQTLPYHQLNIMPHLELTNLAKGVWPVTGSPLSRAVKQEDGNTVDVPRGKISDAHTARTINN